MIKKMALFVGICGTVLSSSAMDRTNQYFTQQRLERSAENIFNEGFPQNPENDSQYTKALRTGCIIGLAAGGLCFISALFNGEISVFDCFVKPAALFVITGTAAAGAEQAGEWHKRYDNPKNIEDLAMLRKMALLEIQQRKESLIYSKE